MKLTSYNLSLRWWGWTRYRGYGTARPMTEARDHSGAVRNGHGEQPPTSSDGGGLSGMTGSTPEIISQALDYRASRAQREVSSPPFLGLLDFSDEDREKARDAITELGGGDEAKIEAILRQKPSFASWYLCDTIRRNYGHTGTVEVWPHIADALGLGDDVELQFRPVLHGIVSDHCKRLALPVPIEDMVSLFRLHAGVADSQLEHLIRAFVYQEKNYGLPEVDDGDALNEWEDNSLSFVPHSVKVLRMPVLWDVSAWHAEVYVRYRNSDRNEGHYFDKYYRIVDEIRENISHSRVTQVPIEEPKLILEDINIAVKIPSGSSRLLVKLDDQHEMRVRPGTVKVLSPPIPRIIRFGEKHDPITILSKPGGVLVGDLDVGGSLIPVQGKSNIRMSRVVIFAREEIHSKDGRVEDCYEISDGFFSAALTLPKSGTLELLVGREKLVLARQPHSRIIVRDGIIGRDDSRSRCLYGPDAMVSVCTGVPKTMQRKLKVKLGNRDDRIISLETDDAGDTEISINELLTISDLSSFSDPSFLQLTLMRPQESEEDELVESRIRVKKDVWPGFIERNGVELRCKETPSNFIPEKSVNILTDDRGYPCIDKDASSRAYIVFNIDSKDYDYKLPNAGLSLTHVLPSGAQCNMPIGKEITLDRKSRGGAVRIKCENDDDILEFPDGKKCTPFWNGRSHTIGFRGMNSGWLQLHSKNAVQQLVKFCQEFEYKFAEIRSVGDKVMLRLSPNEAVESICAKMMSEDGQVEVGVVHFGLDQYLTRPVKWMSAVRLPSGILEVTFDGQLLDAGTWLCELATEDKSGQHAFVDPEGGNLTFVISRGTSKESDCSDNYRLSRVLKWLNRRHAPVSWNDGRVEQILRERKSRLAKEVDSQPGGRSRLLKLSLSDDWFQNATGWFPPMHALYEFPQMFEGPMTDFCMAGKAFEPLARINNQRLRKTNEIDRIAFAAFKNFAKAEKTDEALRDFNFDRLILTLQSQEEGISHSRWNGLPMLGPEHWLSAHKNFQERVDESEFFLDNRYENRKTNLLRLFKCVCRHDTKVPIPSFLDSESEEKHAFSSQCLRSFSVAARGQRTREWLDKLEYSADLPMGSRIAALGDLIRLAPELCAFHLLAADLERRDQ